MITTVKELNKLECISLGSKSSVYFKEDRDHGKAVLIKIANIPNPDMSCYARFANEYEVINGIDKPGLRKAYSLGELEGRPYLEMEYIPGKVLKQFIKKRVESIEKKIRIAISITDVLGRLHEEKIIHKDINSSNLIVNEDGESVTLIDFGLSSKTEKARRKENEYTVSEGTVQYMSPEQTGRVDSILDYRTDFYSLGVTLYELFTGRLPFESDNVSEVIHSHIARKPISVTELIPDVPQMISNIISKLLEKNSDLRYQTADGLSFDLKRCLKQYSEENRIDIFTPGEKDFSGKLHIPNTLYGRDNEKEVFRDTFEWIKSSHSELLLITGEEGVGKTKFVNSVINSIPENEIFFVVGELSTEKQNSPYSAIVAAVNELVNHMLLENEVKLKQWKDAIYNALGENISILIDMIPRLELLVGKQKVLADLTPKETSYRFHEAFNELINAVVMNGYTLIMFIDNIQHIDQATVDLLTKILPDFKEHSFLVIGAYRDKEVTETHRFVQMLKELDERKVVINTIALTNMTIETFCKYMSITFQSSLEDVRPFSKIVYSKTRGNIYRTIQLLKMLYERKIISPNIEEKKWYWDLKKIDELPLDENTRDFIVQKINKLKKEQGDVLGVAASIGNRFKVQNLAGLTAMPVKDTSAMIDVFVDNDLVLPFDDNYKLMKSGNEAYVDFDSEISFLNESVREIALSLISKKRRKMISLDIARRLSSKNIEHLNEDEIFEITDKYNNGFMYISKPEEKLLLANMNLIAGRKAKMTTAYKEAIWYLSMGIGMLRPADKWIAEYELTRDLYLEAIEAEYLSTNFERAEQLATDILENVRSEREKNRIYQLQILFYTDQNKNDKAISVAFKALKELGIKIPEDNEEYLKYVKTVMELLKNEDVISSLVDAEFICDEKIEFVMETLMNVSASMQEVEPERFPVVILKMMELTVKHGFSEYSAFASSWYSMILFVKFTDTVRGAGYRDLAINLLKRCRKPDVITKVEYVLNACLEYRYLPLPKISENLELVYRHAIEAGDIEYAYYSAIHSTNYLFFSGNKIREILHRQNYLLEMTQKYRLEYNHSLITIWRDSLLALISHIDEKKTDILELKIEEWKLQNNTILLFSIHFCRLMINYIFGKYDVAIENAEYCENICTCPGNGFLYNSLYYYYYALSLISACSTAGKDENEKCIKKVKEMQKRIKLLADMQEGNFRHKDFLLEAEIARIEQNTEKAVEFYGRAIDLALNAGNIQDAAMAYELEAQFFIDHKRYDHARYSLREAEKYYSRWGAEGKVRQLYKKYRKYEHLAAFIDIEGERKKGRGVSTSSGTHLTKLDFEAVLKAARILSEEITLENLLDKLLNIVMEYAGAERGAIIENRNSQLFVNSIDTLEENNRFSGGNVLLEKCPDIPVTLINYVSRTKSSVLLENASTETVFSNDRYIKIHQPKSLLCLPIEYQGKLSVILYLENNLIIGAFTKQHIDLLKMLSSHIAVSIENASLYVELRDKIETQRKVEEELKKYQEHLEVLVNTRTMDLEKAVKDLEQARFEAEYANRAKSEFLSNMSHEIRTPMNAVLGFADILIEKELDPQKLHYLEAIRSSGHMLLNIINDILDLSKIESGKMELQYTSASIESLNTELMTLFHQKAKDKGILFEMELKEGIPDSFIIDNTRLRQVLVNLLSNSLKFTHEGFIKLKSGWEYCSEVSRSEVKLTFEVTDSGVGIPEDQQDNIFSPFEQVKNQKDRDYGGTGLGLAISKKIIELMGGDIQVKSVVGKGSTFMIILPEVEIAACNLTPDVELVADLNTLIFSSADIIIADDIDYNIELLSAFLSVWPFSIRTAKNGAEAIELVKEKRPDLILLDMKMPVMDGYSASKYLKDNDDTADIPIIAVTASALKQDEIEITKVCNGYLRKPIKKKDLINELMKYLKYDKIDKGLRSGENIEKILIIPPDNSDLKKIHTAALRGELVTIKNLCAEIKRRNKRYTPFVDHLEELARQYNDEEILIFIEKYFEE